MIRKPHKTTPAYNYSTGRMPADSFHLRHKLFPGFSIHLFILITVLLSLFASCSQPKGGPPVSTPIIDSIKTNIEAGNRLIQGGDLPGALEKFNMALKTSPDNSDGYRGRGSVYLLTYHLENAEKDFNRAIDLNPASPQNYLARGDLFFEKRQFEKAREDYEKARQLNPDDGDPYYNLGWCHLKEKNYRKAEELFNEASHISPDNFRYALGLGELYYQESRFDEAERSYLKALEIHPDSVSATSKLAIFYSLRGKSAKSLEVLTKGLENVPNPPHDRSYIYPDLKERLYHPLNKERLYYERALAYFEGDNLEKAKTDLDRAIEINHDFWAAYVERAQILQLLGKQDEADRDVEMWLKNAPPPRTYDEYILWGSTHQTAKKWEKAVHYYTEAIKIDPDRDLAYFQRGECYREKGDLYQALKDFNKVIQMKGTDAIDAKKALNLIRKNRKNNTKLK